MTEQDPDDNSSFGVSGVPYYPDTRTEAEQQRDSQRFARRQRIELWKWRLRGLLPRGWKDDEHCG